MPRDRTPGVCIEEDPAEVPVITPAPTAIPAFLGCTERAQRDVPGNLHLVPTRIRSLAEFEALFGGPPSSFCCGSRSRWAGGDARGSTGRP